MIKMKPVDNLPRIPLQPLLATLLISGVAEAEENLGSPLPALPASARLVLEEDWSGTSINPQKWYVPKMKWGGGNNGVNPENVFLRKDLVGDTEKQVLVCQANGDKYDGPVIGHGGNKNRVGGIVVSNEFFASGRFELTMKIGSREKISDGPADPMRPIGTVPAVWTYAYRYVRGERDDKDSFTRRRPLYNPHMKSHQSAANEYWSELDFPEFGKAGNFDEALYNTFLQNKHHPKTYKVTPMIDGKYHTLTTDWRTGLRPLDGVTDSQVTESEGFWWINDKSVAFDSYFGNPLKKLGKDRYAVFSGVRADHYLDGVKVAENTRYVPSMAAQLTFGIWLPDWAGPAPWKVSSTSFSTIKVWQFDDEGDVRGVLSSSVKDNY